MKRTLTLPVGAALIALTIAGLLSVPALFAHASIASVAWDNPSAPTKLIAKTGGDLISSAPGEFSLKVLNSSGIQVDSGNAQVAPNFTEISVGVPGSLPSGTYRVEWVVVSVDSHRESGNLSITLTRGSTATAPATTAMAADMHSHADEDDHAAAAHGPTSMEKVTFEARLTGANEVPPVSSAASAFARFTFSPANNELTYAVTASGVAPGAITGLHFHSGGAGENGPHVFDIINAPFTTVSGKTTLSASAVSDLYAGNLYLRLHTVAYPNGAARAQLIVPKAATTATTTVRPPSTGDGGLVQPARDATVPAAAVVLLAVALAAAGGSLAVVTRRR